MTRVGIPAPARVGRSVRWKMSLEVVVAAKEAELLDAELAALVLALVAEDAEDVLVAVPGWVAVDKSGRSVRVWALAVAMKARRVRACHILVVRAIVVWCLRTASVCRLCTTAT